MQVKLDPQEIHVTPGGRSSFTTGRYRREGRTGSRNGPAKSLAAGDRFDVLIGM